MKSGKVHGIAEGYELLSVANGQAAPAALATRLVPPLVTDYRMPGKSGADLAQAVMAISSATCVVLLAAVPAPMWLPRTGRMSVMNGLRLTTL